MKFQNVMNHKYKDFENKVLFSIEYARKCWTFPDFGLFSYLNTLSSSALNYPPC